MSIDSLRFPATKLAEYMSATPARRNQILENVIEPTTFIVDRYGNPMRAITRSIEHNDLGSVRKLQSALSGKQPRNNGHKQRLTNSIECLAAFAEIFPTLDWSDIEFAPLSRHSGTFVINALEISVLPNLLLFQTGSRGRISHLGCLKYYISKSQPLKKDSAAYLGCILHWFAESKLGTPETIDHNLCRTIEVFEKKIHVAPRATIKRRAALAAACLEIVDRLPSIAQRTRSKSRKAEETKQRKEF